MEDNNENENGKSQEIINKIDKKLRIQKGFQINNNQINSFHLNSNQKVNNIII